jgi:acyl carrier protein
MSTATADYQEICAEVIRLLEHFAKPRFSIGEDTELVEDLGLESIQVMEIIQQIEDRFDISFPLNNLLEIRTVGDFVLQIQKEIKGA